MSKEYIILLLFFFALNFTIFINPKIRKIGINYKIIDLPNSRKSKSIKRVRIGGLGIYITYIVSFLIFICLLFLKGENLFANNLLFLPLLSSGFFFLIGFLDDKYSLSPLLRLLLQFLTAVYIWINGIRVDLIDISFLNLSSQTISIPIILSFFITCIWFLGTINAINWIDGLDGLATGCALIMFGSIFIINFLNDNLFNSVNSIILIGICIGFLKYNFRPAKLLMGDGGSYFLGFFLAYLALYAGIDVEKGLDIRIPFLILLYPLVDMTFVIFNRLRNKSSPFYPDQKHFHHKLLKYGFEETSTVFIIYFICLFSTSILLICIFKLYLLVLITNLFLLGLYFATKKLF